MSAFINPDVIASDGLLFQDSVTVYYKEFIDYNDGQYEGINDGRGHSDVFIGYGFLENDDGELVPVIYDTDMEDCENPEYKDVPDYEEPFFYVGTADINGVTYDKWRKIETNEENYAFNWDTDAQQYVYTNRIVNVTSKPYLIKEGTLTAIANRIRRILGSGDTYIAPDVIQSDGLLIPYSVEIHYREYIDWTGELYDGIMVGENHADDTFVAYEFLENNEGNIVPVLYKTEYDDYPDEPDYLDEFFYVGTAEIDGIIYDKWRKIESGSLLNWDSVAQQYVYTNVIVIHRKGDGISPIDMPSKIDEVHYIGYNRGYSEGNRIGYRDGQTVGYEEGHSEGYNEGYDTGHEEGHGRGYNEGYANGEIDGVKNLPRYTGEAEEITKIAFTIGNGYVYYADINMTWYEWVHSDYNITHPWHGKKFECDNESDLVGYYNSGTLYHIYPDDPRPSGFTGDIIGSTPIWSDFAYGIKYYSIEIPW